MENYFKKKEKERRRYFTSHCVFPNFYFFKNPKKKFFKEKIYNFFKKNYFSNTVIQER